MNQATTSLTRTAHSEAFKQFPIEACCAPGASVAGVALANGINANQLRRWSKPPGIPSSPSPLAR